MLRFKPEDLPVMCAAYAAQVLSGREERPRYAGKEGLTAFPISYVWDCPSRVRLEPAEDFFAGRDKR